MPNADYITSVLSELAAEMGITGLALNEDDQVAFRIDGTPVTFAYTDDEAELLWIYVEIGALPAEDDDALRWLLRLSLPCWASNCMTIGLDGSGTRAIGYTVMPASVAIRDSLRDALNALLETAFAIRDRLANRSFEFELTTASASGGEESRPGSDMRV